MAAANASLGDLRTWTHFCDGVDKILFTACFLCCGQGNIYLSYINIYPPYRQRRIPQRSPSLTVWWVNVEVRKTKVSLSTNWRRVGGSRCIAPYILSLSTKRRWGNNSDQHLIGGWLGLRTGLENWKGGNKEKFLDPLTTRTPHRPSCNLVSVPITVPRF